MRLEEYGASSYCSLTQRAESIPLDIFTLYSNNVINYPVYIHSDSQSALKSVKQYKFSSSLILACNETLQLPPTLCHASLVWVPGHDGVSGNYIADILAKEASGSHFISL